MKYRQTSQNVQLHRRHPSRGERDRKVRVKPTALAAWAELLLRVFGVDGLACPVCEHRLRLRALVLSGRPARRILAGLARSAARGPPR
jgi:hypothetical protein